MPAAPPVLCATAALSVELPELTELPVLLLAPLPPDLTVEVVKLPLAVALRVICVIVELVVAIVVVETDTPQLESVATAQISGLLVGLYVDPSVIVVANDCEVEDAADSTEEEDALASVGSVDSTEVVEALASVASVLVCGAAVVAAAL